MDLMRRQTAIGIAWALDAWERAGSTEYPEENWSSWASLVADMYASEEHMSKLGARAEQIGMDHAIRRKLGWEVEPGTLATLELLEPGLWLFHGPGAEDSGRLCRSSSIPALEGVTDPDEALKVLHVEVCDV
jgi:hypothetical protein